MDEFFHLIFQSCFNFYRVGLIASWLACFTLPQWRALRWPDKVRNDHINLIKAKLHRARVTHCIYYEGSYGIDASYRTWRVSVRTNQSDIYNVNNGKRFRTLCDSCRGGLKDFRLTGGRSLWRDLGDVVIIAPTRAMD